MAGEKKQDVFIRSGGIGERHGSHYAAFGTQQGESGTEEGTDPSVTPPDGAVSRALEEEAAQARGEPKPERDPEAEFMANAVRRAYDQELEALAGLALFRSYMSQMGRGASSGGILPPPSKEELNARLHRILDDSDQH